MLVNLYSTVTHCLPWVNPPDFRPEGFMAFWSTDLKARERTDVLVVVSLRSIPHDNEVG